MGRAAAYLEEDHGGDLLGREGLLLAQVLDLNHGAATLVDDLEGPRLDVLGDGLILESATDQTPEVVSSAMRCFRGYWESLLDVEDGVGGVHGSVVLRGLTNQALLVGKGDKGGGSVATLLVGNLMKSVSSPCTSRQSIETY